MPKIVLIGENEALRASLEGVLDNLDHGFFTHTSARDVNVGLNKIADDTRVIICDNDTPSGSAVQAARYLGNLGREYPKLLVLSERPGMARFFDEVCADEPYYGGTTLPSPRSDDFVQKLDYALAESTPVVAPKPVTEPATTVGPTQ